MSGRDYFDNKGNSVGLIFLLVSHVRTRYCFAGYRPLQYKTIVVGHAENGITGAGN